MEPEKLAIAGVTLVIVTVGLMIGVSFLTFPTGDANGENPLTGIVADRDLLELGLEAPEDWTFEMSDGSTLTLSDLRGQVVIVDLMATWCTACASQNSYLETVYQNMAGTAVIISLTVDGSETAQMMETYKNDKGLLWDHGLDTGEKFDNYFNVVSIPTIILIDASGIFRYMHVGLWSAGSISNAVASIL